MGRLDRVRQAAPTALRLRALGFGQLSLHTEKHARTFFSSTTILQADGTRLT